VAVKPFRERVIGRSIGVAWRENGPRAEEAKMLAALLRDELFKTPANPV
jgi:hypothetical protein